MNPPSAIDRLADELSRLSDADWARATGRGSTEAEGLGEAAEDNRPAGDAAAEGGA